MEIRRVRGGQGALLHGHGERVDLVRVHRGHPGPSRGLQPQVLQKDRQQAEKST